MCAAIDMLASEQVFYGHSPPAGFLADYAAPARRPAKLAARGHSAPCLSVLKPVQLTLRAAPRSCIRLSTEKKQKRVVFADDRGHALEQVRFMTEPSHEPPPWALRVAAGAAPARAPPPPRPAADVWELRFAQPASDYLEFRRKITEECVALENVIIKQSEGAVDGTVKVKNLDFLKEVVVRASADGWRTSEDTSCAFVESGPPAPGGAASYDTFGFRLQLPIHSRRLDFCVCFRCRGAEYWDSRRGENYAIERASVRSAPGAACARLRGGNSWAPRAELAGNTPYW